MADELVDGVVGGAKQAANDFLKNQSEGLKTWQNKNMPLYDSRTCRRVTKEEMDAAKPWMYKTLQKLYAAVGVEIKDPAPGIICETPIAVEQYPANIYDKSQVAISPSEQAGASVIAGSVVAQKVIKVIDTSPVKIVKNIGEEVKDGIVSKIEEVSGIDVPDKGNKKKKTNSGNGKDNVQVKGTPSQCKKIEIKVDGSDYPTDKAPKPELRSHTEEWTVSTETRGECKQRLGSNDGTKTYQEIVKKDVVKGKLSEGHKDYLSNEFGSEMGDAVKNGNGKRAIEIVSENNEAIDEAASGTKAGPTNKHNYHHIRPRWAHGHLGNVGGNESGNLTPSPVRHQTKEGIHGWWNEKLDKADGSVKRQLGKCPKIKKCKSKMNPKLTECNVTNLAKCIKKSSHGKSKLVVVYKG